MSSSTLREQAYRYIHGRIASGTLRGGSLVSELSLAKEIGISRTPVREAIRQLIMEGLVEQVPRYGTIVRTLDRTEIAELYGVREALEGYAAAVAARQITPEDVELLGRLLRHMEAFADKIRADGVSALDGPLLRRFLAADMGFHMVLIRATGNRRLTKTVADMGVLIQVFGLRREAHTLPVISRACRFHAQILKAVRQGDAKAARAWMVRHLRAGRRRSLDAIDRLQQGNTGAPLMLSEDLLEELRRMEEGEA